MNHGLFVCNWGAMATKDGEIYIAGGARIPLPEIVAERLLNGEELGPVMDDFTKKANISKKISEYGMLLKYVSLDLHNSSFEGNIMTEYI